MAARYERVNTRDVENPATPETVSLPQQTQPIPSSPPPSFHSRSSSLESQERRRLVDPDLAEAFDAEGDDDDDARQRLIRGPAPAASGTSRQQFTADAASSDFRPGPLQRQVTDLPRFSAPAGQRVYGGGIQSDGVFSNLTAKPERGDSEKEEQPPSYEQAAADAAPPYWETTILAPGLAGPDEVYIDGMPVGSVFSFAWNGMISMSFQIVGFLLTYLLHSTHAAKNGSRAGLGITLIQYGFYMRGASGGGMGSAPGGTPDGYADPPDPNAHDFDPGTVAGGNGGNGGGGSGNTLADIASSEWVAYILMIVGWFILIRAVSDYLKARRHEQLVLQSPDRGLGVPIIAEGESSERVV